MAPVNEKQDGESFNNPTFAIANQSEKDSNGGLTQNPRRTSFQPSGSILDINSEELAFLNAFNRHSDSDDEPVKISLNVTPPWAESPALMAQLKRQQRIDPHDVFGKIKPPALDDIFRNSTKSRCTSFRPRSSSANWTGQDMLTREEVQAYGRAMGYQQP
jgi:hypothetical protein